MKEIKMKKNKLWFRRKTYGWGWTPITWEGWFATAMLVVIPLAIRFSLKAIGIPRDAQYFYAWASAPILIMILTLLCFRFGEKPKWQWGIKRTKVAQIELLVSDYKKSIQFYDKILLNLGWEKLVSQKDFTFYTDGTLKLFLTPGRKSSDAINLTKLSFYAETKEIVDEFEREVLIKNNIVPIKVVNSSTDKNFKSISFLDPDGIELKYMYSPFYCDKEFPENNLESNYHV